ncbi:hypothetical protein H7Y40_02840 [Pedobacter sp.]|nr:hypothetical protein [Candidatus Saccharibacteria bacterium]
MPLSVPRENLATCSQIINERITYLTERGYSFRDDRCVDVVRQVVGDIIPQITDLYQERVLVEAGGLFVFSAGESQRIGGGSFSAKLARLSIQQVTSSERLEGFDGKFVDIRHDLGLVFRPEIADADPVDLVFGDEILIAMAELERLELAS